MNLNIHPQIIGITYQSKTSISSSARVMTEAFHASRELEACCVPPTSQVRYFLSWHRRCLMCPRKLEACCVPPTSQVRYFLSWHRRCLMCPRKLEACCVHLQHQGCSMCPSMQNFHIRNTDTHLCKQMDGHCHLPCPNYNCGICGCCGTDTVSHIQCHLYFTPVNILTHLPIVTQTAPTIPGLLTDLNLTQHVSSYKLEGVLCRMLTHNGEKQCLSKQYIHYYTKTYNSAHNHWPH